MVAGERLRINDAGADRVETSLRRTVAAGVPFGAVFRVPLGICSFHTPSSVNASRANALGSAAAAAAVAVASLMAAEVEADEEEEAPAAEAPLGAARGTKLLKYWRVHPDALRTSIKFPYVCMSGVEFNGSYASRLT